MRTCRQCANLAPSGRYLAAWRGESFGVGIAVSRRYEPSAPDVPQRCGAYAPGPDDPDRRTGRELARGFIQYCVRRGENRDSALLHAPDAADAVAATVESAVDPFAIVVLDDPDALIV